MGHDADSIAPCNLDNLTPFVATLDYDPSDSSQETLKTHFVYVLTPEEAISRAARMLLTQKLTSCAVYIRKEGERIADLQCNWDGSRVEVERWDGCSPIDACIS